MKRIRNLERTVSSNKRPLVCSRKTRTSGKSHVALTPFVAGDEVQCHRHKTHVLSDPPIRLSVLLRRQGTGEASSCDMDGWDGWVTTDKARKAALTSLSMFMKRDPNRQGLCRWHWRELTVIWEVR